MNLKIKVCGMRESSNIQQILDLKPDYMGFIFQEKSPRFAGEILDEELLKSFPKTTKKVGVFVNAHIDLILRNVKKYSLDIVQLHGDESPEMCRNIRSRGVTIIKAFPMENDFKFNRLNNFKTPCDYFLFDTKGHNYGGNGVQFDWDILQNYDNSRPFFLSGGISLDDVEKLKKIPSDLNLHAFDINSKFEDEPGFKNVEMVKTFINNFRNVLHETTV